MSSGTAAAPARKRSGPARAILWLLALQVGIALLLIGGDLARIAPGLFTGSGVPALDTPVTPGDQTRRFAPRLLPGVGPGFPGGEVPGRLAWEETRIGGEAALLLTGEIAAGDAERFGEHLDGLAEAPATVALHSPGGVVADALAIGRRLRDAGIATRVGPRDACLSACPLILAGGVERTVSRAGMVGVHQQYFGENTVLPAFLAVDSIQRGQAEVMTFLDAMGVSPLLMVKAMETPPEDIYVLVEDELTDYALATAVVD